MYPIRTSDVESADAKVIGTVFLLGYFVAAGFLAGMAYRKWDDEYQALQRQVRSLERIELERRINESGPLPVLSELQPEVIRG